MLRLKTFLNVLIFLFFVEFTTSKATSQSGKLKAYQHLVDIINSFQEPKGIPFVEHIPSPKSLSDRIAIVGAGPAGIHMAYLLKKEGFTNIVVLEKTNNIGGKSNTIKHRNVFHEMGTCYLQPDYDDNVVALAKEIGLWKPVGIPSANVWLDQDQFPSPYPKYVVSEAMKILKINDSKLAQKRLFSAMIKYCLLHRELFGKYDGELMRKPAPSTMNILDCTFSKFLSKYNISVLKPIFIASHTTQGYGHLDEISALYGLMWNTPNFLKGLAGKLVGKDHGLTMINGGFQGLWETVRTWANIEVWFKVNIKRIQRKKRCVYIHDQLRGKLKFDFLIWTPSVLSNLDVIDASQKERKIFSKLDSAWFTTTLFDSTYGIRGSSPIDYWISNIENKRECSVWAQRDSYGTLNHLQGPAYQNGSLPGGPDGKFVRTGVAYQYGKRKPSARLDKLTRAFYRHFKKLHASHIRIVKQKTWEYFPRFSPQEMATGVLWDIFEMQGSRRTWFAGSSVIFESVKSVLEYNKLLVSKMTNVSFCNEY